MAPSRRSPGAPLLVPARPIPYGNVGRSPIAGVVRGHDPGWTAGGDGDPGRREGMVSRAWRLLVLAVLVGTGCGDSPVGPGAGYARLFDEVWSNFDRHYSYFQYKDIDWAALGAEHRPAAEAARTEVELLDVLESLTAPLRDMHVFFRGPDGRQVGGFSPDHFVNWDREVWQSYMGRVGWRQVERWGHGWFGEVGYIAIGSWGDQSFTVEAFDAAFEAHRDDPALILDVRMNPGGSDRLALAVAERFATRTHTADYARFRDGPAHDDFGPTQRRTFGPRGDWQFSRPVAVLSGRGVYSSNESFISAMRELPHVTVMGDTTGGATGNPRIFELTGDWEYGLSTWLHWDARMNMIEWKGVAPEIDVPGTPADFDAGRDPVIDYALHWAADAIR